jgi:hypothetical protein
MWVFIYTRVLFLSSFYDHSQYKRVEGCLDGGLECQWLNKVLVRRFSCCINIRLGLLIFKHNPVQRISLFMDPMWLIGSTFHHLTAPKEEGTKRGIGRGSNKRDLKIWMRGGILFSQCSKLFSFSYFLLLASNQHGRFHSDS